MQSEQIQQLSTWGIDEKLVNRYFEKRSNFYFVGLSKISNQVKQYNIELDVYCCEYFKYSITLNDLKFANSLAMLVIIKPLVMVLLL